MTAQLQAIKEKYSRKPICRKPRKPAKQALIEDMVVDMAQAAELLGMSRNTMYKVVQNGDIPSIRIGDAYRIPTVHLRKLLGIEVK